MTIPLVLVGCGYTLTRLAARERSGRPVVASTRDEARRAFLEQHGVEVLGDPLGLASAVTEGAEVVVSIPPAAGLDVPLSDALRRRRPRRLVYVSSTGVYGAAKGRLDEDSPVGSGPQAEARVRAEGLYRAAGAVILRSAGIYGPGRGLHDRLASGSFRLPGDGSGHVSRVHVEDLVTAIQIGLASAAPGAVLNVADDAPVTLREVVAWLCERLQLPIPESEPLEQAPLTLRGDRMIQNARLKALGWSPRYPSFREGYAELLTTRC